MQLPIDRHYLEEQPASWKRDPQGEQDAFVSFFPAAGAACMHLLRSWKQTVDDTSPKYGMKIKEGENFFEFSSNLTRLAHIFDCVLYIFEISLARDNMSLLIDRDNVEYRW